MVMKRSPGMATDMLDVMLEPFGYAFMVRGMVAAVLAGALCGGIGVYVILKRMAYIGHGLAHAVLGGAVVSFVMSFNFLIGSTIWGFVCAQLITLTAKKRKIANDAAIGVITTASFAVGIVLISRNKSFTRDFETALFGNITGVFPGDLVALGVMTAATALVLFVAYKHFLFTTFDGDVAQFYGVPDGMGGGGVLPYPRGHHRRVAPGVGSAADRRGHGHTTGIGPDAHRQLPADAAAVFGDRGSLWFLGDISQLLCGCFLWSNNSPGGSGGVRRSHGLLDTAVPFRRIQTAGVSLLPGLAISGPHPPYRSGAGQDRG